MQNRQREMQIYNDQRPEVNQIKIEMLTGKSTELQEKCSVCKKENPLISMLSDVDGLPVCMPCVGHHVSRHEVPYLKRKQQW